MSYEKIANFCLYIRKMQEFDLDVFCVTSSPKGFGKSSTIIQVARKYMQMFGLYCPQCNHEWVYTGQALIVKGEELMLKEYIHEPCPKCKNENIERVKEFNFKRYLAYDNKDVMDLIHDLPPYSPILPDEAVRFMMGEDWMLYESKQMKKKFAQMRTKHLIVLANIPKFQWMDRKYRDDMCTFWIRIMKRGLNLLLQPDLGEHKDPWHMKELQELMGSYNYLTSDEVLKDKAEKLKSKHPCVFDYFKVPKVPDHIYKEYLKARDAKAFERRLEDIEIDQKEISKVAAYNIIEGWDKIQAACQLSRFKKPTLRILENFVFVNPKTDEPIVRHTTIRTWIKDIKTAAVKT